MARQKSQEKRADRCIICGQNKPGLEVKEDYFIRWLRWLKKIGIIRTKTSYNPVVCKEDYPKYSKARRGFERRQMAYVILGVLFAALLLIAGSDKLLALLYGLILVIFMYLLSMLSYVPEVKVPESAQKKAPKS